MTVRRQRGRALALIVATASAAAQHVDPQEFVQLEPVLRAALQRAAPCVVTVETFGGTRRVLTGDRGPDDGSRPPPKPPEGLPPVKPRDAEPERDKAPLADPGFHQAQGRSTGIVLGADGWILVSRFALNYRPTTILVTIPNGPTLHAVRHGEDTSRGIALLRIEARDLPAATCVDPAEVRVGQWAFALGRTFGADEPTVNIGIVSAVRRQLGRALQVDSYTSPANYGGAVIDIDGRVLGIAVPLSPAGRDAGVEWYDSGIGFCATIHDIPQVIERMKLGEILHRGWLGVAMSESHLGPGAKIASTPKEGVAAQHGIRMGDTILEVDGVPVRNGPHLQMLIGAKMGGERVVLAVQKKEGEAITVEVTLADLPSADRADGQEAELPASFPLPEKKDGR